MEIILIHIKHETILEVISSDPTTNSGYFIFFDELI